MAGYGGIWRDMAGYREIPGDTGRYREIPGDTRYGRIRADTGRYGEIRGDARRCKEIRGDTVRYCRDTSRYRKKTVRTRAAHRRTPRRRARGAPGARTPARTLRSPHTSRPEGTKPFHQSLSTKRGWLLYRAVSCVNTINKRATKYVSKGEHARVDRRRRPGEAQEHRGRA